MTTPTMRSVLGVLAGSSGSAGRRARVVSAGGRRERDRREQGVALVIAISAVAILAVMLADMHESTSTAYAIARNERDRLQAEYMARSGVNLTRLLVAQEPQMRQAVAPIYQMVFGRPPPLLPVWQLSDEVLGPFCDYDVARETAGSSGFDLGSIQGLGDLPGTCQITAFAENSKININDPLNLDGDRARRSVAMQLFALTGGYHSPSPYDPIFAREDPDGLLTSRLDFVTAAVDWWDIDTERSVFDPGAAEMTSSGAEDNVYASFDDPYQTKNAPFDTLEELRLVRGVGDDFWATFVEPKPDDPESRIVTIYGSGAVNVNEAPPEVLLARICSYLVEQSLCSDPIEASKFIQVMSTIRSMFPLPLFTRVADFLAFLEGKGGPRDLYPMLKALLGEENPLLFRPVTIAEDRRTEIDNTFVTAARILTIDVVGSAGRSSVRLRTVVNFHDRWTPPPPNAGTMPSLGVFHYYRME